MKGRKAAKRLKRRQNDYDATVRGKEGFKRPGSNNK